MHTEERDGASSSGEDALGTFIVFLYGVLHGGNDETEGAGCQSRFAGIV